MKMKLEDKILEHRRLHEMQPILEGVTSFFVSLSKDYGFEERLGQKLLSFDITKAIIKKVFDWRSGRWHW